MSKLTIVLFFLLFGVSIAFGQQKQKCGYLFSEVIFAADQPGDYGSLAFGVTIEIKHKNKIIQLTSNEVGVIYENLPKGKYYLISARTAEGVLLDFEPDQIRDFEIKPKKMKRLPIIFLKPKI